MQQMTTTNTALDTYGPRMNFSTTDLSKLLYGAKSPAIGTRSYAVSTRRSCEKTVSYPRHDARCMFSRAFDDLPGSACTSPTKCLKLGNGYTNVLA